jgi:hypothetical protein
MDCMLGLILCLLIKTKMVIEIELYAQQFKWTARYAGEDNV